MSREGTTFGRLAAKVRALSKTPPRVAHAVRDDLAVELAVQVVARTRRDTGRAQASTRLSIGEPVEADLEEGRYPAPTRASFEDSARRGLPGERFVTQVAKRKSKKRDFDYAGHHARRDRLRLRASAAVAVRAPGIVKKVLREEVRRALED